VLLGGMIGYGAANTAFAGIAITLVIRREEGILKRLRATPLPTAVLFGALLLSTLAVFVLETIALFALGRVSFGTPMPGHVASLLAAIVLSSACFAALGIATASLLRSSQGASAAVNVILLPILSIALRFSLFNADEPTDSGLFLYHVWWINLGLLIFNILPVYPLDGGQILRSLLWFVLGRARSLLAVIVLGFAGVAALIGVALWLRMPWFGILSVYILMNCWRGLQQARALLKLAKLPRRDGFACPTCNTPPVVGAYWVCNGCNQPFDTFQSLAACPNCSKRFSVTRCMDCGRLHSMEEWASHSLVARA